MDHLDLNNIDYSIRQIYNTHYKCHNEHIQAAMLSLKTYHKSLEPFFNNPNNEIIILAISTVWKVYPYIEDDSSQFIISKRQCGKTEKYLNKIFLKAKNKDLQEISLLITFDGTKNFNTTIKYNDIDMKFINKFLLNTNLVKKFNKKTNITAYKDEKSKNYSLEIELKNDILKDYMDNFFNFFTNHIFEKKLVL